MEPTPETPQQTVIHVVAVSEGVKPDAALNKYGVEALDHTYKVGVFCGRVAGPLSDSRRSFSLRTSSRQWFWRPFGF